MRRARTALLACALGLFAREASAVRPFVTDDARVVGKGHVQLETWWRRDPDGMQHWMFGAVGPNDRMELSLGMVHGVNHEKIHPTYSVSGPFAQMKLLVFESRANRWPGVATVFGVITPWGSGGFEPPGWTGYAYVALTESLFDRDRVLVHLNFGWAGTSLRPVQFSWGAATELRVWGPIHAIGEVYSGDPYISGISGASQFGVRFAFNDHLQLDVTGGVGLFADRREDVMPPFFGTGVRLVSHELW